MILTQLGSEGEIGIGRNVVSIIGPTGLIGVGLSHIMGNRCVGQIEVKRCPVALPPAADCLVGEVGVELENILDEGKRCSSGRNHSGVCIGLAGIALEEGCKAGLVCEQGVSTGSRVDGDTDRLSVLVDLLTENRTSGKHRLFLVGAEQGCIVGDGQPVSHLQLYLGAYVELIIIVITYFIQTRLGIITPGEGIRNILGRTAHADVVCGIVCVPLVEKGQPVGGTVVLVNTG